MRVAIDAQTTLGAVRSGVGEYTYRLLEGLASLDVDAEYTLYYGHARSLSEKPTIHLSNKFHYASSRVPSRIRKLLIGNLNFPIEIITGKCDVLHIPFGQVPTTIKARRVVTVHDINFLLQPRNWHTDSNWKALQGVIQGANNADHIIADSLYTKQEIIRHLDIPDTRISVVHLSLSKFAEDYFKRAESVGLPSPSILCPREPYALYVGAIEERKGLAFLLEAYKHFQLMGGRHKLVLVGYVGSEAEKHMLHAEELGIASHLSFLGHVSEEELLNLYVHADMFVFPSVWEGFGLPLLEALSAGKAVIARPACSIPEVVGDAGMLVSSDAPIDFAQAMYKIGSSPHKKLELEVAAKKQAKRFSLHKMAKETVEVYGKA